MLHDSELKGQRYVTEKMRWAEQTTRKRREFREELQRNRAWPKPSEA